MLPYTLLGLFKYRGLSGPSLSSYKLLSSTGVVFPGVILGMHFPETLVYPLSGVILHELHNLSGHEV